jgi:hypothetical protein
MKAGTATQLIALALALVVTGPVSAAARRGSDDPKATKPQSTCPVMGGRVNRDLYTDVVGQRIYVCCQGCIEKVERDPEAALETIRRNGQYAQSLQKTCTVMGGKIDKSLYVERAGRRVYVCCKGCIAKVEKDFQKHAATAAETTTRDGKRVEIPEKARAGR